MLGLRKPNFKTTILLQKFQKNEGEPIGVFEKILKTKNENFEESHSAESFNIRSVTKSKNIKISYKPKDGIL